MIFNRKSAKLPFNILKRNFIIIIWKLAIKSPSRREFSSTHAYWHWLADVHLAGFAPAFTLSRCDSEYARKPPVPIASVDIRIRTSA